ncbi:hypothetical protein C8R43DRAFT_1161765, partial [Mycena crocata]
MRFGACTEKDLEFLESRIAGFRPGNPRLNATNVRDVSIITGRNSQKDALNKMGAERFARDHNQAMVEFCSIDRISSRSVDKNKWKGCEQSEIKRMSINLQKQLWDAPPSATNEFIPGKLTLCLGMPVMLRANDATELCITKGQEGEVCGWDSSIGPAGQQVLDTLFVRLVKPPRDIQIEGLPLNVVPLMRTPTHITCLLSDDTLLSVVREQVVLLLNFGMTDYTSQGKNRLVNPVELAKCNDARSYYVALSRGRTAEGTIIVQGFTPSKITRGISGYLRQELRELEILDEITRLRYEGQLPRSVTGLYRRRLIRSFYAWNTDHRDPIHFHPAMKWNAKMGPRVPEAITYSEWKQSGSKSEKKFNAVVKLSAPTVDESKPGKTVKGGDLLTSMLSGTPKRSRETEIGVLNNAPRKKAKFEQADISIGRPMESFERRLSPIGLVWDSSDYSCGYDAFFTIMANIWIENPMLWTGYFAHLGPLFGEFGSLMNSVKEKRITFEKCRDLSRRSLHAKDPEAFPYGHNMTSIDRIASKMLPSAPFAIGRQFCDECGHMDRRSYGMLDAYLSAGLSSRREYPEPVRIQSWLERYLSTGREACSDCRRRGIHSRLRMRSTIRDVPPIMLFDINHTRLSFTEDLALECTAGMIKLRLRGVIYAGQGHFTARVVDTDGHLWFHDGIGTRGRCLSEGHIQGVDPMSLHRCGEKHA